MLCGASHEDVLPHVNFSFDQSNVLYSALYPFPCLAARARGDITEPESLHGNSHIQKKNTLPKRTEACDISGYPVE